MKGLLPPLFPGFFLLSSSILALFKTFRNSDVLALILKRFTLITNVLDTKLKSILLQALTRFCRLVLQSESVGLTAGCSLSRLPPEWGSLKMADGLTLIVPVMHSLQPRALTTLSPQPDSRPTHARATLIFPGAASMQCSL